MRSTILRALTTLLLGIATAAWAADSTGFGFPDVPWQKPWARTADGLQGMPTSCPDGQVLTVGSGGAFSCVEATASTTVNQCSASVTLVGGKTYQACCNAAGTVTSIGGGQSICKFSGSNCPGGWSTYQNWSTTTANNCNGFSFCFDGSSAGNNCGTSGHGFANIAQESCSYVNANCTLSTWPNPFNATCSSPLMERGCI